jgi:hypothetical protein
VTEVVVQINQPNVAARIAEHIGLAVLPMHPDDSDPILTRWYHITVPPGRDAEELARRLMTMPYVDAAYTKPPEDAP